MIPQMNGAHIIIGTHHELKRKWIYAEKGSDPSKLRSLITYKENYRKM